MGVMALGVITPIIFADCCYAHLLRLCLFGFCEKRRNRGYRLFLTQMRKVRRKSICIWE